jgi:hypothetical protein
MLPRIVRMRVSIHGDGPPQEIIVSSMRYVIDNPFSGYS